MKWITEIIRLLTGLVFILSGFVKAVDPRGFSFKLEEYFSPAVFDLPQFQTLALPIAVLVILLEVGLGLMLVFKVKLKQTLLALIALCIFFGFLTFYSARYNVVTDCGCFGDAVKLTPWQSFWKDILLLVMLIWVFIFRRHIKNYTPGKKLLRVMPYMGLAATVFIMIYGLLGEPMIDFRDYKIGTDLKKEKQLISENPSAYSTLYTLKNTSTGEEKKVDMNVYTAEKAYWEEGTPWVILPEKTSSTLVKEGYQSEIAKFYLTDKKGNDHTADILGMPRVVLLFSYEPESLTPYFIQTTEKLLVERYPQDPIFGVSNNLDTFKFLKNLQMDGTAIKTIGRSNPFVLVLEQGVIKEKYPAKDLE